MERFEFGKNWRSFLKHLDDRRITEAQKSLQTMLDCNDLQGKTFLDAGCGSGLFSLSARMLGASVRSFDYDSDSVECTRLLKQRYFPDDDKWEVTEGDLLDIKFVSELGKYDIVYCWGVVHHTGQMWKAMDNLSLAVKDGGRLFISVYNRRGTIRTALTTWRKREYSRSTILGKTVILTSYAIYFLLKKFIVDVLRFNNPLKSYLRIGPRGMSMWHDIVDWVGGYPFETARPEEVFDFYRKRGFILEHLKTCGGGLGCNEFVFQKPSS